MSPTLANGKICYIEIPASDIARSADFKPASLARFRRETQEMPVDTRREKVDDRRRT
jgi:hypothetical protein